MRVPYVFGLILLFKVIPAVAETVGWQSCVTETTQNNSELRASEEVLRASQDTSRAAYSGFLPQVNASVSATKSNGVPDESYATTLSASQNLFSGLQDKAKVDQSAANTRAAEAQLRATKAKISYDLKSAFAALVFAQDSVKLQGDILNRRKENLRLVELRFESGRENKGSLLLSQAYLAQSKLDSLQAKNDLRVAQSDLARVLGRDDDADLSTTDQIPVTDVKSDLDFKTIALATPDYQQSMAQESASEAGLTLARSGFFPSLGVSASYGRQDQDWLPQTKRWSLGATLSIPLFSGGKDYFATRSAAASFASASASRANVDRNLVTKLRQAHSAWLESIEKLKVDQSFLEASQMRAEIARKQYSNGLVMFQDWDLIENDLISRQRAVLNSQKARVLSEASFEQAQGKGVLQ